MISFFPGSPGRGKPGQRFGSEHDMAAVQQPVVLLILKGRREIEKIQCAGEVLNGIVEIGRGLGILANDQVVELTGGLVLKNGADKKGGGATLKIPAGDPLRGGQ